MAKNSVLIIRVSQEHKERIERAAKCQGLSLTTFVTEAALGAAKKVEKKQAAAEARAPEKRVPRKTSGACPTFFRAVVLEAQLGGAQGYVLAGRQLLGAAASLIAADDSEELYEKYEELGELVYAEDEEGVLGWFDRELPRCMALIPRRRRSEFLRGVYQEVEENPDALQP
jgi:Protein of unknown function (DUF1778)